MTAGGNRRRFGAAALGLGLALAAAACAPAPPERPNVILIVVDTLRADFLGAYGFQGSISPTLDALAAESVVFERCFAQSPWTKPSVASILTSLYPQVHGLTNHDGKYWGEETTELKTGILPDSAVTLAEAMQQSGYATAAFVGNSWLTRPYGFAQGFDVYDDSVNHLLVTFDQLTAAAMAWLDGRSGDTESPFFLYLHPMDVHAPYNAAKEDYDALVSSPSLGLNLRLAENEVPYRRWQNIERRPPWASDQLRRELTYWKTQYASGVRALDRRLAPFLDYLRESGLLDRSYLVFTSDHGEQLFEHGDWSHGQTLHDHQLHIPLMIRQPGAEGGGRTVPHIVEQIDLMPTLLSLIGADAGGALQGRDVSQLLRRAAKGDLGASLATATHRRPNLYSLRSERYKLFFDVQSGEVELFDLNYDPGEQRDVAVAEPEVAAQLQDQLVEKIQASLADGTLESETADIPDEMRRKLEALGYLQ